MSSVEKRLFVSVEDYLAAEEINRCKSEYIEGLVRAMYGGTNRHNQVKCNCLIHFGYTLRGKPCRPFDSDTKVRIQHQGRTRFYYPDLQIVCNANAPTDVFQDRPVLIAEVLSPSTRQYDLDEKMTAYLGISSLEYYVVLEQHQPLAIVMRRNRSGYQRETYAGVASTIPLPTLDCSLPLCSVYDQVEFTDVCVQEAEVEYEVT